MIVEPLASKKQSNIKKDSYPQKHAFFHDITSERLEKQEKLLRDIFDHNVDKRTLTAIKPLDLTTFVPGFKGKRSLDDSYIDLNSIQEFQTFDKLAEGMMRIVFDEALESGFFGLLAEQKCRSSSCSQHQSQPDQATGKHG